MGNGQAKGGYTGDRRSTSQRHLRQESGKVMKAGSRNGNWNSNLNSIENQRENFGGKDNIREGDYVVVEDRGRKSTSSSARGDANIRDGNGKVESTNMFREEDELVEGWPKWLADHIPMKVLKNIVLKTADSYTKIDKVGQGTYSNVYKARDKDTGKIVALKKVRFDTSEPESVKFMAREIIFLQKLDHPNIVKLEGLATSRMQYSLYLVFDFMHSDLSRIVSRPDERLTEPQIKCYMQQLLSGLQHCHERGILHRDIKGSNLLIDRHGVLKIADFGLGIFFNPERRRPLTNRVVTLWYRSPELLLGSTDYGIGIDLWSAGCLMAEMFHGRAIMPGRTEIEQLHRIFRLCGTPPDDYYKRLKLSTALKPPKPYKSTLHEAFRDFPLSAFRLLNILLALDPAFRGTAGSALQHEFFHSSPLACDLSGLPFIHIEEDNEKYLTSDNRKHRTSKGRRRSKSQRDQSRTKAPEEPKDAEVPKEEPQRSSEISLFGLDPGSSTTSTSSTSARPPRKEEIQLYPSPVVPNHEIISPRTDAHLYYDTKNIKNRPPLTAVKRRTTNFNTNAGVTGANRSDLGQRSASTRESRSSGNRNLL